MTTRRGVARRRGIAALACVLSAAVLSGCVADPPPPTVVGEEGSDGEDVRRSPGGVLLALDRVDEGFNPHLLSDQGVDTDLAASLLLPSAFVPGPDGRPERNRDLLESAEVLLEAPDTVRYVIRQKAQWSDGVPVGAEDFEYLWRQMISQPGVVDPSGYERILEVRPGAGGKVVDVVFDSVPGEWRSLFTNLLPGHILKDAPDGFQGAMRRLPVMSAGPFMVRSADIGRGEIEFVRNDRYWAEAPPLDQILVRRATGAGQLGAALRSGPGSALLVSRTPVAADVAGTVPGASSEEIDSSTQLELALNTVAPTASDLAVRRAITSAVTPEVVGRIVTGSSRPEVTAFPFPDSAETPETGDRAAVNSLLTGAGYTREGARWTRGGDSLSVTLGVESADDRALTAAYTVADQLRAAGIGARVWELDPAALYGDALPHGLVDGVVGWQRVDGDAETAAVSRFACSSSQSASRTPGTRPSRTPVTVTTLVPPEPDTGETTTTAPTDAESAATTTPTTVPRTIGESAPARASGLSGLCDPDLDRALGVDAGGTESGGGPDLRAAGDLVAEQALRIPLVRPGFLLSGVQDGGVVAAEDRRAPGPRLVTEVFDTAPTWRRSG